MTPQQEEKIQLLAFGELGVAEEQVIRLLVERDPEAAATYEKYIALRKDLGLLQVVPADQLSRERLRARILEEGIKPKKVGFSLGWAWMPLAAAALGFVLYSQRANALRTEDPQVVATMSAPKADPEVAKPVREFSMPDTTSAELSELMASEFSQDAVSDSVEPRAAVEVEPPAVRISRRSPHKVRRPGPIEPTVVASKAMKVAQPSARMVAMDSMTGSRQPMLAAAAPEPSSESIVVISNSSDMDTGAQHATEQDSAQLTIGG